MAAIRGRSRERLRQNYRLRAPKLEIVVGEFVRIRAGITDSHSPVQLLGEFGDWESPVSSSILCGLFQSLSGITEHFPNVLQGVQE